MNESKANQNKPLIITGGAPGLDAAVIWFALNNNYPLHVCIPSGHLIAETVKQLQSGQKPNIEWKITQVNGMSRIVSSYFKEHFRDEFLRHEFLREYVSITTLGDSKAYQACCEVNPRFLLLMRNYSIVKNADAVFAFGYLDKKQKDCVKGGTGFSVQLVRNLDLPTFIYELKQSGISQYISTSMTSRNSRFNQ